MKRSRTQSRTSDAMWSEWMAEAQSLLQMSPEAMTAEQGDRLDALSDALIHLVGFSESLDRDIAPQSDPKVLKLLRHRHGLSARGDLSNDERASLRQRILSGLQATQLHVRAVPIDGDAAHCADSADT